MDGGGPVGEPDGEICELADGVSFKLLIFKSVGAKQIAIFLASIVGNKKKK